MHGVKSHLHATTSRHFSILRVTDLEIWYAYLNICYNLVMVLLLNRSVGLSRGVFLGTEPSKVGCSVLFLLCRRSEGV